MEKLLDEGISKLYFTISEVGSMVEEEAHVLRYWETEFRQLKPKKNKAGKRIYTRADVDTVYQIRHLLRNDKFTLACNTDRTAPAAIILNTFTMCGCMKSRINFISTKFVPQMVTTIRSVNSIL